MTTCTGGNTTACIPQEQAEWVRQVNGNGISNN